VAEYVNEPRSISRAWVTVLSAVVIVGSVQAAPGLTALLTVLVVCFLAYWVADVTDRPEVPCRCCDRGRDWDRKKKHLARRCPGWAWGLMSCHRAGTKLRWEVKVLRVAGVGRNIQDPTRPDH
jgi:hypothetical protein